MHQVMAKVDEFLHHKEQWPIYHLFNTMAADDLAGIQLILKYN